MNSDKIKIAFFGDFFVKNDHPMPKFSFEIDSILKDHDFSCINMEGPVKTSGAKPAQKVGPSLHIDKKVPRFLEEKGFSAISLANNHSMDYGKESLMQTIGMFQTANVFGAGSFEAANTPLIFEKKGKKIGILATSERQFGAIESENDHGYSWINHPTFLHTMEKTKKECDFLFVFAHCGLEDIDTPLPQWRDRLKTLIRHGADAIISTHTHHMQGMEVFEGKPIFYSLGNFFFGYQKSNRDWNEGYFVSLEITDDKLNWKRYGYEVSEQNEISLKNHDFKILDDKISSPLYFENIEAICMDFWEKVYKPYYQSALVSLTNNKVYNIKLFIKHILGKTKINHPLLLHNIMIESHRYATEIALRKITQIK